MLWYHCALILKSIRKKCKKNVHIYIQKLEIMKLNIFRFELSQTLNMLIRDKIVLKLYRKWIKNKFSLNLSCNKSFPPTEDTRALKVPNYYTIQNRPCSKNVREIQGTIEGSVPIMMPNDQVTWPHEKRRRKPGEGRKGLASCPAVPIIGQSRGPLEKVLRAARD